MSRKYRIIRRGASLESAEIRIHRCREKKEQPKAAGGPARQEQPAQLTEEELQALQKLAACYSQSLEYFEAKSRPWPYIWTNLILGMAKGFGVAIGITLLAFVALKILNALQILNLPLIGDFIAELLDYVNNIRDFGK
ncbi:MAG: DUF5665 domain-containing protein [Bacillota bacterium]|nr:DUF5665 domain-containing protein [Bacillota bacterium]